MYRIDILLKENRQLFHTRDLALLWGIENDNTLYTVIKRYVKKGILIPIYKGFYSTVSLENIDPLNLGITALSSFAYVSCEYVLSLKGIIFQSITYITLISDVSKKFKIGKHEYLVRKLKDIHLFNGAGIYEENGVKKATAERAYADLLYYNPNYHIDNRKGLDFKKVNQIRKEVGFAV
ncbi:hypothetical protein A2W14_04580 [Candidatus Gottesmanbacteria bacterium RBG_16_37_8]|uniref:AbiEi antitoxin C-terminal domain-containing protein n=1 Tax=Candidatus Gottesmanbacteria bacterium RBG_16_37_8 TaxID=1798371 RepID=A0A1F5YSP1_9BACT|nr:MAG: hypothetical protein A2W14_04580 [Candidatus Gottesmanbacteria bacterium RBG_16_37_8]